MRHSALLALAATAGALAACAKRPDAIAPAMVPTASYERMSCAELAQAQLGGQAYLQSVAAAQDTAATNDAIAVFFVGVPLGSAFGGDKEGLVAEAKGRMIAISAVRAAKSCPSI